MGENVATVALSLRINCQLLFTYKLRGDSRNQMGEGIDKGYDSPSGMIKLK
jgi:hypothetical protein